ncbi:MAG: restriction system-associated AAA family ATPase [Verrucomicrobiota bacterium]
MKLLRLKLDVPFRSLPAGFQVDFLREWDHDRCFEFHPYCLAGRNGSGKSNVLEALAAIFYHIECIYLENGPDNFRFNDETSPNGFRAEVCMPDAFELEYFMPLTWDDLDVPHDQIDVAWENLDHVHVVISKEAQQTPKIYSKNLQFFNDKNGLLSRARVKRFLPKYIIGYSSGHNEILSLPFFKMRFIQFDEYRDHLTKDVPYNGKPEGRMIYLDDQFSQAILICHFLFPSEAATKVFEDKVGLKGISRFRIIIRRHQREKLAEERLKSMALSEKDREDRSKITVELTSKLSGYYDKKGQLQLGLIDKLIKCSTTYYEDSYVTQEGDESSDLYLDYWVNKATKRAFQVHFGEASGESDELDKAKSALNLFQAFQTLLTLNHYKVDEQTKLELYQSDSLYFNETIPTPASHERITRFKDGELMKDGVTEKLYVKSLSDGEQQLLHTIGLCLLYRHESALFLLDEPETHLNPDWRASYISVLRDALKISGSKDNKSPENKVMREVLLTSHSPFIISDCRKENVLVFTKDPETRRVTWERPEFETFGTSANAITIKVFGQTETIGDYAMARFTNLRQRLKAGEDPDELIKEAAKDLGDSVEKVLFVNQVMSEEERRKKVNQAAVKKRPVKKTPIKKISIKQAPTRKALVVNILTKKAPAKKAPAKKASAKKAPIKKAPIKKAPVKKAPVKKVPAKKVPAKKVPAKKVPAKKVPAKKVPAKKVPAKKVPAKKTPKKNIDEKGAMK